MLLVALMAGSTPRRVGDGTEYVEMASQIAAVHAPGVQTHFWLYPALAAPFVAVTGAAGLPAEYGFAALNVLLLSGAFWVVTARFSRPLAFLLFSGPIIWWIDKPHTEVLTFATMSVAVVLLDEAPWWSVLALGVGAMQNLAMAPLVALAAAVAVWRRTRLLGERRFWVSLAVSAALVVINVLYYRLATGTVPIVNATIRAVPNVDEIGVVLWDLNVGLIPAFPLLAALVIAGLVSLARRPPASWPAGALMFSACAALGLIAAFSQTPNYNHGGTFGMSRYGLWLIPLAMPLLGRLDPDVSSPRRWVVVVALVSSVWSAFAFHPGRPEQAYLSPTRLARFLWTRFPGVSNPIPEVFVERLSGTEMHWLVPVATARCEKVLLTGRPDFSMWPLPCPPTPVPAWCHDPGRFCYANFNGRSYSFVRVRPPSFTNYRFDRDRAWPLAVEGVVGDELRALRWWQLEPIEPGSDGDVVLDTREMRRLAGWRGDHRLFLYLEPRTDDSGAPLSSSVTLRVAEEMSGHFKDAETGVLLDRVTIGGSDPAVLALPAGHRYLILVLLAPSS